MRFMLVSLKEDFSAMLNYKNLDYNVLRGKREAKYRLRCKMESAFTKVFKRPIKVLYEDEF